MERSVEFKLKDDFLIAYKTAQRECDFKSPIFIRMLSDHGAYETAKRLTNTMEWQKGFEKLAFLGRAELTVEHIILQDEYSSFFNDRQIFNAKEKIKAAKQIKGHKY